MYNLNILKLFGDRFSILDSANLIWVFDEEGEYDYAIRTSVFGFAHSHHLRQHPLGEDYMVSQLSAGSMEPIKPALIQRLFRPTEATKWYSEYLINDHPEEEIFENPAWCLSDRIILGFNQKKLYKWDAQTGELLSKRKTPTGTTHCVIVDNTAYLSGTLSEVLKV